jgi:hypothetical protein
MSLAKRHFLIATTQWLAILRVKALLYFYTRSSGWLKA